MSVCTFDIGPMFSKHCHDFRVSSHQEDRFVADPFLAGIKLVTVCENHCCRVFVIKRHNIHECHPGAWIFSIVNIESMAA